MTGCVQSRGLSLPVQYLLATVPWSSRPFQDLNGTTEAAHPSCIAAATMASLGGVWPPHRRGLVYQCQGGKGHMCPHCSVAAIPGLVIPSTEVGPRVGMYGEAKVPCPKWDNGVVGS